MIGPSHEVEKIYQNFTKFRDILRKYFPQDGGLLLPFYSKDIEIYHGLEPTLKLLDRIFTAYFGIGNYRNLVEIVRLASILKCGGIEVQEIAVSFQLNFNGISSHLIHHDSELTPIILSQFSYPTVFGFGGKTYGADIESDDTTVELGDTQVQKVIDNLTEERIYNEVWVIPIYRSGKTKILKSIFRFTRGEMWDDVLWWVEREENDDRNYVHKEMSKIMSKLF